MRSTKLNNTGPNCKNVSFSPLLSMLTYNPSFAFWILLFITLVNKTKQHFDSAHQHS